MRPRKTVAIYHPHPGTASLMRYAIEISTSTRVSVVATEQELATSGTDGKVCWNRSLDWDGKRHTFSQWIEFMDRDGQMRQRLKDGSPHDSVMEAVRLSISRKRGPRTRREGPRNKPEPVESREKVKALMNLAIRKKRAA
jgi:hypothetical protein